MCDYISVVDVLAIHIDLIERYGGSHGVRDHGYLKRQFSDHNLATIRT